MCRAELLPYVAMLNMNKIIDCMSYNGEQDLLEIHLNVLNDYVDQFIIVEAPTTFSGRVKPLYYEQQKERFKQFWPKIKYFVIDENYSPEEVALAEGSPNTKGATHWKHEFLQKENIKKALTHLKDDDTCFIGDVDEIWNPMVEFVIKPSKILLKVYSYYLNNRSSEIFRGTFIGSYKNVKNKCLNHLRSNTELTQVGGWHFTSMGGYEEVKRKLDDSYTKESYNTDWVQEHLQENIEQNKDFLGRDFGYKIDESDWPQWLKDNKEKYQHLCL